MKAEEQLRELIKNLIFISGSRVPTSTQSDQYNRLIRSSVKFHETKERGALDQFEQDLKGAVVVGVLPVDISSKIDVLINDIRSEYGWIGLQE